MGRSRRLALCAVIAAWSGPALAQDAGLRAAIGPHLGLNFDGEDAYLGFQGRVGVAEITPTVLLQLYPSASYYFAGDPLTVLNFSFDVPFEFVIRDSALRPYAAPGLGLWYVNWDRPVRDDSDIDLTLNLLGGLLFALDGVEPFFELRLLVGGGYAGNVGAELRGGVVFVL
jgi:hypothetical protein